MEKLFNAVSVGIGFIGGICSYFLGGFDVLVVTLLIMTLLDYITGVIDAYMRKTLSSSVGFKGILKKVMIYIVVVCAVSLNRMIGNQLPLREIVITFFVANEGLSLIENVSPYLPVPDRLKEALLQLRDKEAKR